MVSTQHISREVELTELMNFSPRQREAEDLLDSGEIKYLLYGGALGGGKSYFLRWYSVKRLVMLAGWGYPRAEGMLACEDYPSLKDRQLSKIEKEFPRWLGTMHSDHRVYGRCFILNKRWGGGVLCFRNLDDSCKYASAEFAFIAVDELTKNDYDVFTFLRTRIRWPLLPDMEALFFAGTNPGSVGHGWVKQLWMDQIFGSEWINPIDYRSTFAYVPSLASDNPYLDESYWDMLQTLPPGIRQAFVDGDWEYFVGQAFSDFSKIIHVIKPAPIPENAPLYFTYDWGFGRPFSIGWWWVDADNRVYRFAEWYGWNGTADKGLRLGDSEVAEGIVKREKQMGLTNLFIQRLSGHDCFAKRPDYKGGGQGPTTAEVFSHYNLHLGVADSDRSAKIRAFRERLRYKDKEGQQIVPMLLVYENCRQFIRTIPTLTIDATFEDVDKKGEDHAYDEACQICMARPVSPVKIPQQQDFYSKRIDFLTSSDRMNATAKLARAINLGERSLFKTLTPAGVGGVDPFDDADGVEDGGIVSTIKER